MNTTLMRDAARAYGKNYDPDFADSIVRQTATILREGEIPTVAHYKQDSRRVKRYLQAFELIFFFQKIPVHESGVGRDGWLPTDSGVANAILDGQRGEGGTLSLARIFILNEILALNQNAGHPIRLLSYKSKHGKVVDLIWNDCAIKISNRIRSQVSYDEKGLAECIKKLKLKKGYLLVPYSHHVSIDKSIQVVPWTHWS